jgi:hypothetical protein
MKARMKKDQAESNMQFHRGNRVSGDLYGHTGPRLQEEK